MRLSHLHLPKPIPYSHSLKLQEAIVEKHFAHKALLRSNNASVAISRPSAPAPTLLTFQTYPTYTVGRRHLTANPLSPSQISFLTGESSSSSAHTDQQDGDRKPELATFFPSPRGGLLTYHAPGQLTAYLILNLRTHGFTPRCYIRMLENTVMRTCARHGVTNTLTTDDPGVWIGEQFTAQERNKSMDHKLDAADGACGLPPVANQPYSQPLRPTDRKICAIGVHVSRGITSHGIGLNVFDAPIAASPLHALYRLPKDSNVQRQSRDDGVGDETATDTDTPAPGYLSWGFSRIVACGLEGKSVTWLQREQAEALIFTPMLESVAETLAEEVARSLSIDKWKIDRRVLRES